jgi:hypothetical protein
MTDHHVNPEHERLRVTLGPVVGVTASRTGLTEAQHAYLTAEFRAGRFAEAHHGDCVGGDAEFHEIALAHRGAGRDPSANEPGPEGVLSGRSDHAGRQQPDLGSALRVRVRQRHRRPVWPRRYWGLRVPSRFVTDDARGRFREHADRPG